jgi:hypothetical protein
MSEPSETAVPRAAEVGATEIPQVVLEDCSEVGTPGLARALQLIRELQVSVTIDGSGWLKGHVELRYQRGRGGTIQPLLVRVGNDALDADVLAEGGVLARCRAYNDALDQLRQVALRLGALVRDRLVVPVPGTATALAHDELARLDEVIAHRQATHMGHSTVRLDVLAEETAYFQARGVALAPIVRAAERAVSATWDGDTQDVPVNPACGG